MWGAGGGIGNGVSNASNGAGAGGFAEAVFDIEETAAVAFDTVFAALPNLPFYLPLAALAAAAFAFFFFNFLRNFLQYRYM